MIKVLIRVDAGPSIGYGHLSRMLVLAHTLQENAIVTFAIRQDLLEYSRSVADEFEVITIASSDPLVTNQFDYGSKKQLDFEVGFWEEYPNHFNVVIVDHYNVSAALFSALKNRTDYLVYVNDLDTQDYGVDLLINANVYAEQMTYRSNLNRLIGLQYYMIDQRYCNWKRTQKTQKTPIKALIALGGSDPNQVMLKLPEIILKTNFHKPVQWHIVIGPGMLSQGIHHAFQCVSNKVFHESPNTLFAIMREMDVALVGCGTLLYEAIASGLSSMGLIMADNQIKVAKAFQDKQLLVEVMTIKDLETGFGPEKIKNLLSCDFNQKKIDTCQLQIDGFGAQRIANKIFDNTKRRKR